MGAGSGVRMEGQRPLTLFLDSDCWLAAQWNPTHLSPNSGLREAPLGLEGGCFADMLFLPHLLNGVIHSHAIGTIHFLMLLNQRATLSDLLVCDLK